MDVIGLLIALLVFAVVFWVINSLIPIDPAAKRIVNAILAVVLVLWLLTAFFPGITSWRIGPTP